MRIARGLCLCLVLGMARPARPQASSTGLGAVDSRATPSSATPGADLYQKLRRVPLSAEQTYLVREASIDRPGLHVSLEDGKLSFLSAVDGRITGAFFEGDGEILLTPPNTVERGSMALLTGMAILEERFTTAFFRFDPSVYSELKPNLRPTEERKEFAAHWNETAQNLSELDALRLFVSFSHNLPAPGAVSIEPRPVEDDGAHGTDRFLHARVDGRQLGAFDVFYDSTAYEQVMAGQSRTVAGATYFDVWTSFSESDIEAKGRTTNATVAEDEISVQSYKLKTEVRPPTSLGVDAVLKMKVRHGGQRTLVFELSRFLQVKQVESDGHAVEFINNPALDGTQLARRGNDLVAVVFPAPLRDGQDLQLHFVYGGDVLSEAGGGLLYVGARGAWYPNRGITPADFDMEFRYPPDWTLVATGKKVAGEPALPPGESAVPDDPPQGLLAGTRVSRWISERPIALAGFNLGKYRRAVARAGSVEVETYAARGVERAFPRIAVPTVPGPEIRGLTPPPDVPTVIPLNPSPARNAQAVADGAARSVEFFSKRFGEFPYSSLALTQMPGPISQGWPGLIFLSSLAFLSPEDEASLHMSSEHTALRRLMLPHETAHQWWGDLVLWNSYHDQWLVEALANYCALMQVEVENPPQFRVVLEKYRADLLEKNKDGEELRTAGPVTLGQRLSTSHFPAGYEAISYGRGTWLFHMLRYTLLDGQNEASAGRTVTGEEPFVRALRKVRERYAGKSITTEELLSVFAEELPPSLQYDGKKSLDWFLDGWVHGTALPRLSARNVKFAPKGKGSTVSGVLVQKEAPVDLVTSVPIYALVGGKNVFLGRIFADGAETPFHLSAPAGASRLLVDPLQTLLTSRK